MIFKDTFTNDRLNKDGFVVLDWLDKVAADTLINFCVENKIDQVDGFSNSMNFKDDIVSTYASELIQQIFSNQIKKLMVDVEPVIGSFAIKGKGENGRISLHQDWSITDEKKNSSYNIWCALEDMTFKNGCMAVLPKSHLQPFSIRGSMINNLYSIANPPNVFKYWIENYSINYINLKKGQALIYDQKLVHFSTENLTSKSRIAVSLVCIPKNATLVHYNFNNCIDTISKFSIDKSFFYLKNIQSLDLNKLKMIDLIQLDSKKDIVFDQVKNAYYPDNIGVINWFKKKYYKLKDK